MELQPVQWDGASGWSRALPACDGPQTVVMAGAL